MSFFNDDFMSFMGYRYMLMDEAVSECLSAANRRETTISIDRGDFTDDELRYIEKEVRSRLGNGVFIESVRSSSGSDDDVLFRG